METPVSEDPDEQYSQFTLLLCHECKAAFMDGKQARLDRRPHHWSWWCPHKRGLGRAPVTPRAMFIWREWGE
jgi:hypothetical protein